MSNQIQPLLGKKILIAEDNATNRLVVSAILDQLGATYDLANDGVEAINLFDANHYDLALLDIEMPRKSGLDVIRHIRKSGHVTSGYPIVALTAFVLHEHRQKIMDAGASGIIAKPIVNFEEFGKKLLEYFELLDQTIRPENGIIDLKALDDLESALGSSVMANFIVNLENDLSDISKVFENNILSPNVTEIRANLHKLVSLAGMAGANDLLASTQKLYSSISTISSDEVSFSLTQIQAGIGLLRAHLQARLGS